MFVRCFLLLLFVLTNELSLFAVETLEDALAGTFRITDRKTSGTAFFIQTKAAPVEGTTKSDADLQRSSGIKDVVLVTTAHFFDGLSGNECWVVLRERKEDGTYARREHRVVVRENDKPRWRRHPEQDIAVIAIELPDGVEVTPFQVNELATEKDVVARRVRVAQEAWIPGYPAQLEANAAGWPVVRRGTIASHPLAPVVAYKTMMVHVSSFGGDSGAPVIVFTDETSSIRERQPQAVGPNDVVVGNEKEPVARRLIAGMVLGMHRQSDKTVSPFEERTQHTPLALSIVIQAPLIKEVIDDLLKP